MTGNLVFCIQIDLPQDACTAPLYTCKFLAFRDMHVCPPTRDVHCYFNISIWCGEMHIKIVTFHLSLRTQQPFHKLSPKFRVWNLDPHIYVALKISLWYNSKNIFYSSVFNLSCGFFNQPCRHCFPCRSQKWNHPRIAVTCTLLSNHQKLTSLE